MPRKVPIQSKPTYMDAPPTITSIISSAIGYNNLVETSLMANHMCDSHGDTNACVLSKELAESAQGLLQDAITEAKRYDRAHATGRAIALVQRVAKMAPRKR